MEIHHYIDQATSVKRTEALRKKPKDTLGERVPLVVTYHPQLPQWSVILRKNLPILHVSEQMRRIISSAPMVAYRRPKHLKDLLVRGIRQSHHNNPTKVLVNADDLAVRPAHIF